jgi:recombinational DNA repair protein (RecF pathway)
MARGVRTQSSKSGGGIQTFSIGELTFDFRPDRDLHPFRDFRPGAGNPSRLGRGLLPLAGASWLAELILAHALETSGQPGLFERIRASLGELEEAPEDALPSVILGGGWGILQEFGFSPELDGCLQCGVAVDEGGLGEARVRFHLEAGGLLCPECGAGASGVGPQIGPLGLEGLRGLVAGETVVPLPGARAHLGILERFASLHLALRNPFRSTPMLREALPNEKTGELPEGAGA